MKRIISITIAIFVVSLPNIGIAAKTGKIVDDSIFVDTRIGFRLTVPENWKIKIQKDKKKKPNYERVVAIKKNYKVNTVVRELHGEFTIPTLTAFADSNQMNLDEYSEYVLKQLYQINTDDDILLSTELLSDTDLIDSFSVELDGVKSKRMQFKHRYKRFLDTTGRDINWQRNGGVKLVQDFNIIDVAIFKRGDWIIMLYASCEREFYQINRMDFVNMLNSIRFDDEWVGE
ncbi:MAG: hypothetical protein GY855_16320 [candidate division Zixibacteria bacterium]|nr:hypothetical protein [candidate division Zixibacteria bacterium]